MNVINPSATDRREAVLRAAVGVFGRYGYRKTSMEDLAEAAGLSKQGLYLHFSGKEEIFLAAMQLYLEDGLKLVGDRLAGDAPLSERLADALDGWFGRHLDTFAQPSFDVIETGDRLSAKEIDGYKAAFKALMARAIADAPELAGQTNACTPEGLAQVLFIAGLSWKQPGQTRAAFGEAMRLCVRACCQIS